ncbi:MULTISPECIES: hypothetical protein [Pseudomonas]|uniref:hypothetical protein n=1 Tax=Pseudomonas nitroreducens TaxID=46680 RepID=UPI001E316AA4|nr:MULTISPECIES: hypothetical protein [Pseudomonas]MCE4072267.1 hypothetical protein [Pseudomonas nitritireducens]
MDKPPVRLEIRSGNGASYLQEEDEWPIARTVYPRWFFDATPSDWQGEAYRDDFLRLSLSPPTTDSQADYSAEIPLKQPSNSCRRRLVCDASSRYELTARQVQDNKRNSS